jgi:hypothetical protein
VVPALLARLNSEYDDYRIRLGVTYVLAEMLRRQPERREQISFHLRNADFPLLVSAAQDHDPTIRLQAAEFLYLLQDPRSIPSNVEAAISTEDASKAEDQLYIIREASKDLGATEKKALFENMTRSVGSSNELIRNRSAVQDILKW